MAKKEKEGTTAIERANPNTEIAEVNTNDEIALSPEFLANISADIETGLMALDTTEVVSAKSLLDVPIDLQDCFMMVFAGFAQPEKNDDGTRVVFIVTDKNGIEHKVAQSPSGSRLTVLHIYDNLRLIKRRLTLTDCVFVEKGREKFGNKPIILEMTKETQKVLH